MSKRGLPAGVGMRHDAHYVEELAERQPTPIGRLITVDLIDPNPDQPRVEIGDLTELTASVRDKGILEPLLVKPSKVSGRWMIIAGERRWRAARASGLREVPCIEMDVDDRAVAEIALIENLQRKDLTPWEEADGLAALCEKYGYTHEEVAKKVGKSRSSVTESLSIATLPEVIRERCRRADIKIKSTLLQIVRQPDEQAMDLMVDEIERQGLTRDEARHLRRNRINNVNEESTRRPFVYRHRIPEENAQIEVRFKRDVVSREKLIEIIKNFLKKLEESDLQPEKDGLN